MFHIIDFSHWVYRNYWVNQNMVRADGHPIGAVSGCCEQLWKLVRSGPSHVAVVLDGGPDEHRKAIYPDYKAQRPPVPDALKCQFDLCAQAIEAFGFRSVRVDGHEADDVIAHLALEALDGGEASIIHTTDKDIMQVVRPGISIQYLATGKLMTEADVQEKYGVRPEQIADWLALMGDSSDNIPGVPKVGEKTAAKLLAEFGDLYAVIQAAHDGDERLKPAVRASLIDNAWLARKSRELTGLRPVMGVFGMGLSSLAYPGYDIDSVLAFCDAMGVSVVADNIRAAA